MPRRIQNELEPMWPTMRAFCRLLIERSPGGSVIEPPGLVASIVPSCPHASVVNGVVYDDPAALRDAYHELLAAYDDAGVQAWRV
jgi:hypothetical protein